MKVTDEEILQFIKENLKMPVKKVAKELKVAPKRVSKIREENGFGNLRKQFTKEQKRYIIENMDIKTQQELADELGFSDTSIGRVWREAGYEPKEAFSPNKEEFIGIYKKAKRDIEVAQYFGTTVAVIRHFAKKIGYKKDHNKYDYRLLSEEQEREIIDMYQIKTSEQLAKEFNCSRPLILKIWMEAGLTGKGYGRQYYSNFDYFETIDCPEKAYYLGWIAADGCVYDRDNGIHQKLLSIAIHNDDRELLERFLQDIESNNPIRYREQTTKNGIITPVATVQIVSDKMCNDLAKYNIVPRKTWTFEPKNIPEEYIPHFLRGYFDGDGTINVTNKRYDYPVFFSMGYVGNENTLRKFKDYFDKKKIKNNLMRRDVERYSNDFYTLKFTNSPAKLEFLSLLYENCGEHYLTRKKDLADKFFHAYYTNGKNYPVKD